MKILVEQLCSAGSSSVVVRKEIWSTPALVSFAALATQLEEEEFFYRALLSMGEHEFRLLSGSGG